MNANWLAFSFPLRCRARSRKERTAVPDRSGDPRDFVGLTLTVGDAAALSEFFRLLDEWDVKTNQRECADLPKRESD
jgi:hypothetical protein